MAFFIVYPMEQVYADELKIKDALQLYFSKYHFENGGYDKKWFRIKLGPVFIPLPNTKDRIAAVKIHDIHHLLTEYPATLKGEAEIGAWEIASGCGKYYVAWILNLGSLGYGLIFFPKAVYRAFMNGVRARTNMYYQPYDEPLLNTTVGELRIVTGLRDQVPAKPSQYIYFALWCLITFIATILFYYGLYVAIRMLIGMF